MWSARPLVQRLRSAARLPARSFHALAARSWEIAPAHTSTIQPALCLPDQWGRIRAFSEFSSREGDLAKVRGDAQVQHAATRALLFRDVILSDGVLYKGAASLHLHPRSRAIPALRIEQEIDRGAVYCTFTGNKYFGQWLLDDCPSYLLAAEEGVPVTTAQPVGTHTLQYETAFGMKPLRAASARFRELVIFDDVGQNPNKHARFRALGDSLRGLVTAGPHPGVFMLRGTAGVRRVLCNEIEIAERLRDRYGLTIVDPLELDVPEIARVCAGAQMVVGVEGSGLIHGILQLERGGGLLVLQPPERFSAINKDLTDRDGQRFGFVVGHPRNGDFWIDPDEVERTFDLFPGALDLTDGGAGQGTSAEWARSSRRA